MRASPSRAGFSLLELTVSTALLALVFTAAFQIGDAVTSGSSTATSSAKADEGVGRAIERLAERLKDSGSGWFFVPMAPGFPMHDVEFQRIDGYDDIADAIEYDDERIFLERIPSDPDDGLDNDGNGLADDGRVVWVDARGTPQEVRTVVCDRVPEVLEGEVDGNLVDDNGNGLVDERGLAIDPIDAGVRIRLTVVERDKSGRDVVRTAERVVWFRNEAASKE